jgi:hypothetical protein
MIAAARKRITSLLSQAKKDEKAGRVIQANNNRRSARLVEYLWKE